MFSTAACCTKANTTLSGGAPFVGALDGFTSGLTKCVDIKRRLLSSWTGAAGLVRADRTGQPTFEIPFKADGTWDTGALLSFAGSDSCYLVSGYDQTGGAAIVQSSASIQPRLVNAGVLDANGAVFDGITTRLEMGTTMPNDIISASTFQICLRSYQAMTPLATQRIFVYNIPGGGLVIYNNLTGTTYWDSPDRINGATDASVPGAVSDLSCERFGTSSRVATNNVVTFSGTVSANVSNTSTNTFWVGDNFEGAISSFVIWNTGDLTLAAARRAALA